MPKYTEHFHLEPRELDLIERALRREISIIQKETSHEDGHGQIRNVNKLLGKLFNQKKFYSHVNNTGVPAG